MREQLVELVQQLLGPGVANPARAAHVVDACCWWQCQGLTGRGVPVAAEKASI
jgi:hypothetical protein